MRVGLGKHFFKVKAIDPSGNIDPSPAKAKFRVVKRLPAKAKPKVVG
jgi:hypothetical protein